MTNTVFQNHLWRRMFGRRYLQVKEFADFAKTIGVHGVHRGELEELEEEGHLIPSARVVLPARLTRAMVAAEMKREREIEIDDRDEAIFHVDHGIRFRGLQPPVFEWDQALDPLDLALDEVPGVTRPIRGDTRPWDSWKLKVRYDRGTIRRDRMRVFYAYWQAYQLYLVRRQSRWYRDGVGWHTRSASLLEDMETVHTALACAATFYRAFDQVQANIIQRREANKDGWVTYTNADLDTLERAELEGITSALLLTGTSEETILRATRWLLVLHHDSLASERTRMAESIKQDIERLAGFLSLGTGQERDDISKKIRDLENPRPAWLDGLPKLDAEREAEDSQRLVKEIIAPFNKATKAASWKISESEGADLTEFMRSEGLGHLDALFAGLWRPIGRPRPTHAESFRQLRDLAAIPETVARTLILTRGPTTARQALASGRPTLSRVWNAAFAAEPAILKVYDSGKGCGANNLAEFNTNASQEVGQALKAANASEVVGHWLRLAHLARNFTSHHLVDSPDIFEGNYEVTVNAILMATLATWKATKRSGWK